NYLVVWHAYWYPAHSQGRPTDEMDGARVSPAGNVLDPNGIAISAAPGANPSVAFDGMNYLVAWTDDRSSYSDIYGARVTRAGTVKDPGGIGISTAASDQIEPAVAFDGTNSV